MVGKLTVGVVVAAVTAAGALAAGAPAGTYAERISGGPTPLNGSWSITLKPASYTIRHGGALAVAGTLAVKGGLLTFTDTGGPLRCRGAERQGIYGYTLAGRTLTLRAIEDPCAGRRLVLTAHPLKRVA